MISNEGVKALPPGIFIQRFRKERGLTQQQLADAVGTTKATVSKIERSTMRIHSDWLTRFARALEVSPAELVGRDRELARKNTPRKVPVLGRIAAGNWREALEGSEGFIAAVDVGDDAFALIPEGTSMNRIVPEGAYAVVDPGRVELRDGKVYAVMNGEGMTTLKRYRSEPARLEPESTDPEHRAILLGQEPVQVIGQVTQIVTMI